MWVGIVRIAASVQTPESGEDSGMPTQVELSFPVSLPFYSVMLIVVREETANVPCVHIMTL